MPSMARAGLTATTELAMKPQPELISSLVEALVEVGAPADGARNANRKHH